MKKFLLGLLIIAAAFMFNCQQGTVASNANIPVTASFNLKWPRVEQAVAYEVEVVDGKEIKDDKKLKDAKLLWHSSYIYTVGCNIQLPESYVGQELYWRVRGLNLERKPLSEYTPWTKYVVPSTATQERKPEITGFMNKGNGTTLLYPVYAWIPLEGVNKYEVEILSEMPENPNGTEPSKYRIEVLDAQGFDLYDDKARLSDKELYWRVIGKDKNNKPVGVYSDVATMGVSTAKKYEVAVLGDSITHGGGSISYPPTNWDYSYLSYLDFDVLNLGLSGDTSAMTLERFDRDVLPFHPKYLLILTGSNSLRASFSAESIIDDLESIKQKCLKNDITPIFLTLPPVNPANIYLAFKENTSEDWQEKLTKINTYIKGQKHIDINKDMIDNRGNLLTRLALDGLHLDPPGKEMMANKIQAAWPSIAKSK